MKKVWNEPTMLDLSVNKTEYDPNGGTRNDGWWDVPGMPHPTAPEEQRS